MQVVAIDASPIPCGVLPSKYIVARLLQPSKHPSPSDVTDEGIVMVARLLQSEYLQIALYQQFTI